MKRQFREDFVALFEEIAAYFPDWKLAIEPHCNAATFTRADGAEFVLLHNRAMSPQSLLVSGTYPQMYTSTLVKKPEIKISYRRSPEAIAQHITRRFLGEYIHLFELCVTVKHYEHKDMERGKQDFATLTAVFADCSNQVQVHEEQDHVCVHLPSDNTASGFNVYLDGSYFSKTVTLRLHLLPIPIAKQVLERIRELMTSTA